MLTENQIKLIDTLKLQKEFLKRNFNVKEIWLFGSYARNEQTELSDIDLLVDFYEPIGWYVVDLKDYLEVTLNHKVDLVLKEGISRNERLWASVQEDLLYV